MSARPGVSIALARGKDSITLSGDREPVRSPELQGISGCGIWRLWSNAEFEDLDKWDESWIRFVGIEHRTGGEAIIGTMAFQVFDMLLQTQSTELTLSNEGISWRFA